jgi:Amidohydrolase
LHPRAERFSLRDPSADRIVALAHERRLPVIVHAGRGMPALGRDALALTARYPDTPIILAHAAITDLAWIWLEAAAHPNLFFDTAWWNVADQLALVLARPAGQILFASDTPYGRTVAAAAVVLRAALAAGLSAEQIAGIAGGQLERLLTGQRPRDLGSATTTTPPAPGPLLERVHTLPVAAIARMTTGQGSTSTWSSPGSPASYRPGTPTPRSPRRCWCRWTATSSIAPPGCASTAPGRQGYISSRRGGGFTVLVSVLVFGSLFGVIGASIGVPIAAGIQIVLEETTAARRLGSPPPTLVSSNLPDWTGSKSRGQAASLGSVFTRPSRIREPRHGPLKGSHSRHGRWGAAAGLG